MWRAARRASHEPLATSVPDEGLQMAATRDSTLADPQALIADLQRQLAERTIECDEALAQQAATAAERDEGLLTTTAHRSISSEISEINQQDGRLSVHLRDEGSEQDLSRRPRGAEGHLAVVPAGRQDRRAGPQRRRQVDPAADHGRRGATSFTGEAWAAEGAQGRLPAAGAARSTRRRTCAGNVMEGAGARPRHCSTASRRSAPASPRTSTPTRWTR